MFIQQICSKLQFLSWVVTLSISTLVVLPSQCYSETTAEINTQTEIFSYDLLIAGQDISTNILVRSLSQEKSNHNHWLLPLDRVAQVLNLQVIPVNEQQLELRSPAQVVRIPTRELDLDPQLGLVVSLAKLEDLLAINSEVNNNSQTINLTPQWLALRTETLASQSVNLPPSSPPEIDVISLNSRDNTILGKAFGGEWYVRTYQPDLFNPRSLYIQDARYTYQHDSADYLLGIQPQSWLGQYRGNFIGFTTIQRWGFKPIANASPYLNIRNRLQADQVGRTIMGTTTPETIVKLVRVNSTEEIASTVTNNRGVYRFDNIPTQPGQITQYQLLFYHQDNPEPIEVKTITLNTMSHQLPRGASALLISGGITKETNLEQSLLGGIDDLQTEIAYRYGLTDDLTIAVNFGYHETWQGVGELLYQPTNFPLQVTLSLLNSPNIDGLYMTSQVRLQPVTNLIVDFNSDRLRRNIAFNWQALPSFNITVRGNNHENSWHNSLRLAYQKDSLATILTLDLNQQQEISWSVTSRLGHLQLSYAESPNRQQTELSYNLFQLANAGHGYWLFVHYEAYQFLDNDHHLTTIGWRYRSIPEADTQGFWEISCGYRVGNLGSGAIFTLAREFVPGLRLQLDYKTVSTLTNEGSFSIKIVPSFNIFTNSRQWEF